MPERPPTSDTTKSHTKRIPLRKLLRRLWNALKDDEYGRDYPEWGQRP